MSEHLQSEPGDMCSNVVLTRNLRCWGGRKDRGKCPHWTEHTVLLF